MCTIMLLKHRVTGYSGNCLKVWVCSEHVEYIVLGMATYTFVLTYIHSDSFRSRDLIFIFFTALAGSS